MESAFERSWMSGNMGITEDSGAFLFQCRIIVILQDLGKHGFPETTGS